MFSPPRLKSFTFVIELSSPMIKNKLSARVSLKNGDGEMMILIEKTDVTKKKKKSGHLFLTGF